MMRLWLVEMNASFQFVLDNQCLNTAHFVFALCSACAANNYQLRIWHVEGCKRLHSNV
jgi:hypothetical protein